MYVQLNCICARRVPFLLERSIPPCACPPACTQAQSASQQLQADLARARRELDALQKEKRQLFGRTAQQERDVREAAAASSGAQALAAELQVQLDKQTRLAEARDVALTRYSMPTLPGHCLAAGSHEGSSSGAQHSVCKPAAAALCMRAPPHRTPPP